MHVNDLLTFARQRQKKKTNKQNSKELDMWLKQLAFVKRKNGGNKGNHASNEIHKNGGLVNDIQK